MKQKTTDDIRKEYDHLFLTETVRDETRAYRWFARQIRKRKKEPKALLDIATGGGYFLRELREEFGKELNLTGTDISPEALKIAQKECPGATLLEGVAENLPVSNTNFDVITCLGSLEHFLDIPQALSEMRRISKKDALIFILVPNIFWYKDLLSVLFTGDRKTRNQTQERFASLEEWKRLLESGGLKFEKW